MQNLLLLHGALGASDQLLPLKKELEQRYAVTSFSFPGHGGSAIPPEGFTIPVFAAALLNHMDKAGLEQAHFFGYSMGGYVALYLARHHPERVGKIVTLATKFHWDEATAEKEAGMLDPEKILAKIPKYAESLKERHAPTDWREVLGATTALLRSLGKENLMEPGVLKEIATEVLVLLGDRDKMVTVGETVASAQALPKGAMGMLPGTPHPIEQADPVLLAYLTDRFLRP